MSIRYKVAKQVSGFDKAATAKYAVKTVTSETLTFGTLRPGLGTCAQDSEQTANAAAYRRTMNFIPGSMLKNVLKGVPLSRPGEPGPKEDS